MASRLSRPMEVRDVRVGDTVYAHKTDDKGCRITLFESTDSPERYKIQWEGLSQPTFLHWDVILYIIRNPGRRMDVRDYAALHNLSVKQFRDSAEYARLLSEGKLP